MRLFSTRICLYTDWPIMEFHFKIKLTDLENDEIRPSVKDVLGVHHTDNEAAPILNVSQGKVEHVVYTFLGLLKETTQ